MANVLKRVDSFYQHCPSRAPGRSPFCFTEGSTHRGRVMVRVVALLRMKRGGLDVERHARVAKGALADGCEPDFRPALAQHAPELARALADGNRAELR